MTVCFDSPIIIDVSEPSVIIRMVEFDSVIVPVRNAISTIDTEC